MALFGKTEPKKSSPSPLPARKPPPSTAPQPPATLIGPNATIKGEVISTDNIQIEGRVEGKIKSTKLLIIGEKGQVNAEVQAERVSIRGRLEGDCSASNKVEITSTGKVFGNISAPLIAVAEGAVFRGASKMVRAEAQKALPAAPRPDQPGPATRGPTPDPSTRRST
ncbi:MAG: polymer-forming cytoskeletal protein [Acidobacteriota bacterium]